MLIFIEHDICSLHVFNNPYPSKHFFDSRSTFLPILLASFGYVRSLNTESAICFGVSWLNQQPSPARRVDPWGNVIPCQLIRKSFGKFTESSLEDIWNSRDFSSYKRKLLHNNLAQYATDVQIARHVLDHRSIHLKQSS